VWVTIFGSLGFGGLLVIIVAFFSKSESVVSPLLGFCVIAALLGMVIWTTYGYFLFESA
jgi:hypothetical protein